MAAAGRKIPSTAELASLLFALVLVTLIATFSYRSWSAFSHRSEQLAITREIVDGTNALLSSLKDAETGQRGFLLTGEDRYLEPYRQALAEIPVTLDALTRATGTRLPGQAQRVDVLKPLVRNKLDELEETIELRRARGPEAALAEVLSDRGKVAMDQIRRGCAEIQTVAYSQLNRYSAEARDNANQMGVVSTVGSAGLFVLLILSVVAIQRGIHRRQQLIQHLQESEAQTRAARDLLQTTLGSIGDGVIATDQAGRVTLVNAVAQTLTGWTQEEAAGVVLDRIFVISNDETGETVENPVNKALREGRVVGLANHTRLTTKDGRQILIDDSAAPIRDARENVVGVVLVFRDVTSKREMERRESAGRAELAATNQELQQFAYAASHDLREPLRTIKAFAQLLQRGTGRQLDEQNAEYLTFIISGAQRMGQLVDALLDYSRAGKVIGKAIGEIQTEEVLAAAVANLRGAIEEAKAVVTHDPLPQVQGDWLHFVELFQNLIGNALKYRCEDPPTIHVSAKQQGEEWVFSISDNGQGIAPQYHSSIFELFKRLHGPEYPGSGIGLATCKKIVERNNGRIWVESEVGKGSTFFFAVPNTNHQP